MSAKDWNKLRDKFFNECVEKRVVKDNGMPVNYRQWINIAPHDLFEWFKSELCEGEKQPDTESKLNLADVSKQSEQLKFLIEKFQTPKGNYIIELLMDKLEKEKL